jgi:hypothetical protein
MWILDEASEKRTLRLTSSSSAVYDGQYAQLRE